MARFRRSGLIWLAVMGAWVMAASGAAADYRVIDVVLGTATPGGGFPLYGDALVATVREVDPLLWVTPRNTKGSTENVPLLEAGKLVILARYVLDGIGLDQEKDFDAVYLDRAGDGPAMVMEGRVAALWGGGVGWPGFTSVAQGPAGARFIAPSAEESARIRAKHAFLKPMTIAAGSYPGQDAAIASVGSWSFVLARPTLDDDIAYRLARALHQGEDAFAKRLPQARETTAANTLAAAPRPELIHPGVRRYLHEIGLSPN